MPQAAVSSESGMIRMEDGVFAVYLVFAAVFLGVKAFFGFSPWDIGIYMSGYEWINQDPDMVPYLGQWQLSYQLSGWLCSLFGVETFYGLRLMRIVLLLIMQTTVWLYLRRHVAPWALLAGLLLLTLSQHGAYSEVNYNDWSALWLLLAVLAYHKGLLRSRRPLWWTVVSGFLIGWSVMFRIVNVSFFLLPFAVWLSTLRHHNLPCRWRQAAAFFTGVAAGFAFVVLLSWFTGSLAVLKMTWANVVSIGNDGADSHGWKVIVREYFHVIVSALVMIFLLGTFALSTFIPPFKIRRLLRPTLFTRMSWCGRSLCQWLFIIIYGVFLVYLVFIIRDSGLIGVAVSALPMVLMWRTIRHDSGEFPVLYQLSLFVMLILPLGSNAGITFLGPVMCVLSLPVGSAMWSIWVRQPRHRLTRKQRCFMLHVLFVWCCVALTTLSLFRAQMEDGALPACRYAIDSPKAAHILTTDENAEPLNHLLINLKGVLPPHAPIVTNAPLTVISLLDARPYALLTDIFSTEAMSRRYIEHAFRHAGESDVLPYLLEDSEALRDSYIALKAIFAEYADYETVWSDGRYSLLAPVSRQ